jgi:hypothetical protein
MNKEVIKAMNRKPIKHKVSQWWARNGDKVCKVIFFPVWIYSVGADKMEEWLDSRNPWSEERAHKILSYYIPRRSRWDEKEKTLYFFDGGGWSYREVKRKDRRWWKSHRGFYGGRIRKYLIEEFELEGFEKVVDFDDDCVEIFFKLIQE